MKVFFTWMVVFVFALSACRPADSEMEPPLDTPTLAVEPATAQEDQTELDLRDEEDLSELPQWYTWKLKDVTSGEEFSIEDHFGKVILIETMAIWCPKCYQQQNEVLRLQENLSGRDDFISIGINVDPNENEGLLSTYVQKNGFNWLYVVASADLTNEISNLYGPQFLNPPATPMLIIDKQGETHQLPFGLKSAQDLQSLLMPFLDE